MDSYFSQQRHLHVQTTALLHRLTTWDLRLPIRFDAILFRNLPLIVLWFSKVYIAHLRKMIKRK